MVASIAAEPKTKAPENKVLKPLWRRIVEIVACQIAAVLFVEAVLFCAGIGEEEIFKFDPELGFRHMENKRVTWRSEGFAQSYLDANGMREPNLTVAKPANTYRIAFLGDSITESLQVNNDQTFEQIVQNQLGEIGGKRVQALNFGMSGYSTAQEFIQLKRQVMKYQPDLVVLCYNSRDIFENWTPPDQVITNVRPAALHLPGGKLCIDSAQVVRWFNSPRAKFLRSIDWLRQNSRIYGLWSALDLEWSQHNPWYRAFIDTLGKPKRGLEEFRKLITEELNKKPVSQPAVAMTAAPAAPKKKPNASEGAYIQTVPNAHIREAITKQMPETTYTKVIVQTLDSILVEMRNECTAHGAKFAVALMPVRAQVCPLIGQERAFGDIDYTQEINAMRKIFTRENIPFVNIETTAEQLPPQKQESLFYIVHLAPPGHAFVADQMAPFLKRIAAD